MDLMISILSVLLFDYSTLLKEEFLVSLFVTIIVGYIITQLLTRFNRLLGNCRKGLSCEEMSFQAYTSKMEGKISSIIEYDGQIIEGKVLSSLIRIKNNGRNDLVDNDIKHNLTIETTKEYQFLDVLANPSNNDMVVNSIIKDGRIIVTWDLLKTKEWIDLKVITKLLSNEDNQENQDKSFFDSLKYTINAKNVRGVNRKASVKQKHTNGTNLFLTIILLFFALFFYRITDKKDDVPCVYGIEFSKNQTDSIHKNTIDNHFSRIVSDCYISYDMADTSWVIQNDAIMLKYKTLNVLDSIEIKSMTVKESDIMKASNNNNMNNWMHFASIMMLISLAMMLFVVILLLFRNRYL